MSTRTRYFLDAPPEGHYMRSRWYRWVGHHAYCIGAARGVGYHQHGGKRWTTIRWGGSPCYVLYWPVEKWRCLLGLNIGRPHWPVWENGRPVAFGYCAVCLPPVPSSTTDRGEN